MALIRTLETIRVPPGTHIDLTKAQYDARAHRVVSIGFSQYEDRLTVSGLETLEFKRGEVLGIDKPGKDLAGKIEILDPEEANTHEAEAGAKPDTEAEGTATVTAGEVAASPETGAESAAPVAHKSKPKKA